jgi:hypothetical protein
MVHFITRKNVMGPSRFELESEDPQSPRMPGYPMAPIPYYLLNGSICTYPYFPEPFGKTDSSEHKDEEERRFMSGISDGSRTDILICPNNKPLNNIAL